MIKSLLSLLFLLFAHSWNMADTKPLPDTTHRYIYVHIIHGSRPAWGYWHEKLKAGGKLGGHATIEIDTVVYGFSSKNGLFHIIPSRKNPTGYFQRFNWDGWISHIKGSKVTTIRIPVTARQLKLLKEKYEEEVKRTSYDYAFFGMRCASSCYQMLGYVGIIYPSSKLRCMKRAISPGPLRARLLKFARRYHYEITIQEGDSARIWDK